jgi:hypothetical protein
MDSRPGNGAALPELCSAADFGLGCSSSRFQEEKVVAVILTGGSSRRRSGGCEPTVLRGGDG